MNEETAVEVKQSIVEPAVSAEQLVQHMKRFNELKAKLLDKEDVVTIQNKPFVKRSGWRKIALAFNISDEILKEEKQEYQDHYTWRITVKVTAPNGRSAIGVGACSSNEKTFIHGEHDVYAISHTRAKNRAISDLVGSGEVSAEEIEGLEHRTEESKQQNSTQNQTQQNTQQSTTQLSHRIKWVVKGEEFPLEINTGPYGFLANRVMKPLLEKHNLRFREETVGNFVTAIHTSDMPAEKYDEFSGALAWTIQRLANCKKEEIKIVVEEVQK